MVINKRLLEETEIRTTGLEGKGHDAMRLDKVNHKLINKDKEQTGDHTTLINPNTVPEGGRRPVTGEDKDDKAIVIMEGNVSKPARDVVPVQGKLNEVMLDRAVGIGDIGQGDNNLAFVTLGVQEGLRQSPGVLEAARDPRKGSLIDGWVNELVLSKEGAEHVRQAGPEHLTSGRRTSNVSKVLGVVRRLALLGQKHHEGVTPASRGTPRSMRALTQLIELRGSEGEKFIDFILDAIRASSRARGFPTEEFREAGEAREGVGKGKGRAGRAGQTRWRGEGGVTGIIRIAFLEMGFSFKTVNRVRRGSLIENTFDEFETVTVEGGLSTNSILALFV